MEFRVVISFLCLLAAQASCRSTGDKEQEEAVMELIQEEIQGALDHLNEQALLPNISCVSLNLTELIKEEQRQPCTYQFRCFLMELSKQIPKLSNHLQTICQYTYHLELMYNTPKAQNCSLPSFENDLDIHVFTKCLLQLLQARNNKAKI